MQYEIKKEQSILNEKGTVVSAGWSKKPVFFYDADFCKIPRYKFKERDCYYINNEELGLYIAVAKYGFSLVISACLIIFEEGIIYSNTITRPFSFGKVSFPSSSVNGDTAYAENRLGINFANTSSKRYIKCDFIDFAQGKNLYVNLSLEEKHDESLNINIPFNKNKYYFFLKRFLPSITVSGEITFGGYQFNLNRANSSAYLDWSRFGIPNKAIHYSLYANDPVNGRDFSLCLAGGVGNVANANENCYFYNGIIHKLSTIEALGSEERLDKIWKFKSKPSPNNLNTMELIFKPKVHNGKLLVTDCDKRKLVFGSIKGIINESTINEILIEDLPAHMEFALL